MRTSTTNNLHPKTKERRQNGLFQKRNDIQHGSDYRPAPHFQLTILLDRLLLGLSKIWTALKYHFHRLTAGAFTEMRMPWLKLGIAALAVFILTQKDVQFSINMKAPGASIADDDSNNGQVDQLNLAQPVNLKKAETPAISLSQLDDKAVQDYVQRFQNVAEVEMSKFGIPASVKMGQGILESHAGHHPAVKQSNNHFGAPLSGQTYESAWENWRAHSVLLKEEFPKLFESGSSYKKWANGLQDIGYSNDKKYAKKLVDVIERYQLYLFDSEFGL